MNKESQQLASRIVNCLAAATFEMETFIRLLGVEARDDIPSAAVECTGHPRLLINPSFVQQYCIRDEHLFLLAMHELWHILLAHTRFYPRATIAENIAFDAVINAGLARQFSGAEYRGFFERLNRADVFPALLLRPPQGWPLNPVYPEIGPRGTAQILARLYPQDEDKGSTSPLYSEILDLLQRSGQDFQMRRDSGFIGPGDEKGTDKKDADAPFLIGDHRDPTEETQTSDHPLLNSVIRRIVRSWPPPPIPLGGRSGDGEQNDWGFVMGSSTDATRRVFQRVLTRCLKPVGNRQHKSRGMTPTMGGLGALPNPHDRLASARRALGSASLLWNQPSTIRARVPNSSQAHVYLDVSGSMSELLPHLLHLLLPFAISGEAAIFQFSTVVKYLSASQLRQGKLRSTYGTEINCVLEHLLKAKARRALILTDGVTGAPRSDYAEQINKRHIRLYVVLPNETAYFKDLEDVARKMIVLPPLNSERKR